MSKSLHEPEMILRYLDGELSLEERWKFEQMMEENESLRYEVEQLRAAVSGVRRYGVSQQVATVHKKFMASKPHRPNIERRTVPFRKIVRYGMAIAASICLVVLGVEGYRFYQLSPDKLYAENYVSYEISQLRSNNKNAVSPFEKWYAEGKYASIVNEKKEALTEKEQLILGLAYLKENDAFSAIAPLQLLAATRTSPYRQDGEYYLALAYLKNKDYDKAIELMEQIQEAPTHIYHQQFTNAYIRKVKILKWR